MKDKTTSTGKPVASQILSDAPTDVSDLNIPLAPVAVTPDSKPIGIDKLRKAARPGEPDSTDLVDSDNETIASDRDSGNATDDSANGTSGTSDGTQLAQAAPAPATPDAPAEPAGTEGAAAGEQAIAAGAGATTAGEMAPGTIGVVAAGAAVAAAAAGGGGGGAAATVAASFFTVAGRVADGYVRGAKIFIDANHNGVADPGEDTGVVTDAQGNYTLSTTIHGSIIAVGGTNIDTGLPNTMVLKAPEGSTAINPLTTVLQQYIETHPASTPAAAQAAVNIALGIPAGTNLTTFDPLAATDPTDPVALAAQKVAAQIVAASTLSGGNDLAVINNIVALVDQGHSINLADSSVLSGIFSGMSGVNQTAILAATTAISEVTTLAASGPGSITSIELAAFNTVNDAPVFISGLTADVTEDAAVGTVVYAANAVDVEGSHVTYSLVDNAGGRFAINATTGQVTVAGTIDFATTPTLHITVAASDGLLTSTETVTIVVHDVVSEHSPVAPFAVALGADGTATVTLSLGTDVASYEFSTDGGRTFTAGHGSSFTIPSVAGLGQIVDAVQVRETYIDGTVSDPSGAYSTLTAAAAGVSSEVHDRLLVSDITGGISVEAAGHNSDAHINVTSLGSQVGLTAGAIDISASGVSSDASLHLMKAGGTIGSITVEAGGQGSSADANISSVTHEGASLAGSHISVIASGANSNADLETTNVTGSIASVSVTATSDGADARAEIDGGGGTVSVADLVIDVGTISVNASVELDLTNVVGSIASLNATAGGDRSRATVNVNNDGTHGDVSVSAIAVHATGVCSDAQVSMFSDEAGGTLAGSAVDVAASGVSSEAELQIGHATGSVGNITVHASGVHSTANAEITSSSGGTLTLAGAIDVSAQSTGASALASVEVTGTAGSVSLNAGVGAHAEADIDQTVFGGSVTVAGDGHTVLKYTDATAQLVGIAVRGASAEFDLVIDRADADLTATDSTLTANMLVISGFDDANNGGHDLIGLHGSGVHFTENSADAGSVSAFLAAAQAALNTGAAGNTAYFGVVGGDGYLAYDYDGTGITGVIELSGVTSFNGADLVGGGVGGGGGGAPLETFPASSDITVNVVASAGQTSARNIQSDGSIGDITVSASGDSSHAQADIASSASGEVTLTDSVIDVRVTASCGEAAASHAVLNLSDATGSIASLAVGTEGTNQLTNSSAGADIHIDGSIGNISVQSHCQSSDANASISSATAGGAVEMIDSVIAVTVADSSSHSDAELNLSDATGNIASLSVTTGNQSGVASAGADIRIDGSIGDITVHSDCQSSDAHANISAATTVGTVALVDSSIEVSSNCRSTDAELHLSSATGSIVSLDVLTDGTHDIANADIHIDGSIGHVTVDADGDSSHAQANISSASAGGTVNVTGSVFSVDAESDFSRAELHLSNATGNISSLFVGTDSQGASALAAISLTGTVENVHLSSDSSSRVEADIAQTVFGGSVTVDGNGQTVLRYTGETAHSVDLTDRGAAAQFELVVDRADADLAATDPTLTNEMLVLTGFDAAVDEISLNQGTTHFTENTTDAGSLSAFLAAAQSALQTGLAGNDVYFGVFDGNGYVAYDYDGTGITGVIELAGVTDVSASDFAPVQTLNFLADATQSVAGSVFVDSLNVTATTAADASVHLDAPEARFGVVNVTAADAYSDAELDLSGATRIGALSVTAAGNFSVASADVTTHGAIGSLTVTASRDAVANAIVHTDGSVGDIAVHSFSEEAQAYVSVSGGAVMTHSVIDISTGSSNSEDAELRLDNVTGSIDSLHVSVNGRLSIADAIVHTDGSVGSIAVNTGGESADAQVIISAASAGGTVTLTGTSVDVSANGTSSDANLHLSNASGSIDSLDVSASGTHATATANIEIHGSIDSLSVIGSGIHATAAANIEIDGDIGDISVQAVDSRSCTSGSADMHAQADISAPTGAVNLIHSTIDVSTRFTGSFASVSSHDAELHISNATGGIDSLSVSTGSDHDVSSADIQTNGSVGNITISASNRFDDAHATISAASAGGTVTMTDSSINISSGSSSEAELHLSNASGTIDSLSVTAGCGDAAHATADILTDGSVGSITVNASGQFAEAEASISAASAGGSVTITGACTDVSVNAGGSSSDAELNLSNATGGIDFMFVTANSTHASAIANIDADGTGGDIDFGFIEVNASGGSSDAHATISSGHGAVTMTGGCLDVGANGNFSDAELDLSNATGSISALEVETEGTHAIANANVTFDGNVDNIDVTASGSSSEAELHLTDATGNISSLTVCADGDHSIASAAVTIGGSVGDIKVSAEDNLSHASVSIESATAGAAVSLDGSDIVVYSDGTSSDAELPLLNVTGSIGSLSVSAESDHSIANATVTIDGMVGDVTVSADGNQSLATANIDHATALGAVGMDGSRIGVFAGGTSSDAELNLSNATDSIASLDVHAGGNHSLANANLNFDGNGNVDNIDVAASGSSSEAELHLSNATSIGTLTVSAESTHSVANATVAIDGTVINFTVSADGNHSLASVNIDRATLAGEVSVDGSHIVVYSGGTSSDAEFHLSHATGSIVSLNISADGSNSVSNATLAIDGSVDSVRVSADGSHSHASATIDSATVVGTVSMGDFDVGVYAGATSADAELHLSHATGAIASLNVGAIGSHATAVGDIQISGDVNSVSVFASCDAASANATLDIDGTVGDISVNSRGESEATLNIASSIGMVDLDNSDVQVGSDCRSSSSDAELHLSNATGRIGALTVSAEADFSIANATVAIDGTVGNITVSADGDHSRASAAIGSVTVTGAVSMDGNHIVVYSNGNSSVAELHLANATGSIQSLTFSADNSYSVANGAVNIDGTIGNVIVSADGENSLAQADIGSATVGSAVSMDGNSLHVLATGESSDAKLHVSSATGSIGSLHLNALGVNSAAFASIGLTGTVDSTTLQAQVASSYAEADIAQSDFGGSVSVFGAGHSVLQFTGETAATVTDSSTGEFDLVVARADSDLDPTAPTDFTTLTTHMMEVSGFDSEDDHLSLGGDASTTFVAGTNLSSLGDLTSFLADAVANEDGVTGQYVYFATDGTDGYLAYDYDGTGITGVIKLDGMTSSTDITASDLLSFDTTPLTLTIDTSGTSVFTAAQTIDSLTVTASSGDTPTIANVYTDGSVGNIAVHATKSADAQANISSAMGFAVNLDDSSINVDAFSHDASAGLHLSNATGTIASLVFSADGHHATAIGNIRISGDVNSVTVYASRDASASATLDINGTVGGITVRTSHCGASADATANIASSVGTVDLNDSNVRVLSSISSSEADLHLSNATGGIGSLTVSADALHSTANATVALDGTVGDVTVSADGDHSHASATIGSAALAGSVSMDSSHIFVRSDGTSSEAELHLSHAMGSIGALNVNSESDHSIANATVNIDGTVSNITVSADSNHAHASANIDSATLAGAVDMDGSDIVVYSNGHSSDAELQLSHATGNIESLSFSAEATHSVANATVNIDGTIGNISVLASGVSSEAHANIGSATPAGAVSMDGNHINVTAACNGSSDAELNLVHATGTIASLNVSADSFASIACADVSIDGDIGPVHVNAFASSSDATAILHANTVGSIDVNVAANATANVSLDVSGSSGPISVTGAGGTANISYLGNQHADTIDLTAFSGTTHLGLDGADLDNLNPDHSVNWAHLEAEMLHVNGLITDGSGDPTSFDLNFGHWTGGNTLAVDTTPAADMQHFEAAAATALDTTSAGAYFGVVAGNGYLAYDFNHSGVTGVIEMAGVTDFDPTKIQNLTV